jgi:hypothetical protein
MAVRGGARGALRQFAILGGARAALVSTKKKAESLIGTATPRGVSHWPDELA